MSTDPEDAQASGRRSVLDALLDACEPWPTEYERRSAARRIGALVRLAPTGWSTGRPSEFVNVAIRELDRRIADQIDTIMRHPHMQALESTWRGIAHLAGRVQDSGVVRIKLLNASHRVILRDLQRAPEFDQSSLFKLLYTNEYDTLGGEPFGLIIADYQFGPSGQDVEFLHKLSEVAAASFAPLVAGASAAMFRIESLASLVERRDVGRLFEAPMYARWRAFRSSPDASWVGLVLPRVALRGARQGGEGEGTGAGADTRPGNTGALWGNGVFAVGGCLIELFQRNGWFSNLGDADDPLEIRGLSPQITRDEFGNTVMSGLEVIIGERHRAQLSREGFIALRQATDSDRGILPALVSCARPQPSGQPTDLVHALGVARITHHMRQIMRFTPPERLEEALNAWLAQYVATADGADGSALRPLQEGAVAVRSGWNTVDVRAAIRLRHAGREILPGGK